MRNKLGTFFSFSGENVMNELLRSVRWYAQKVEEGQSKLSQVLRSFSIVAAAASSISTLHKIQFSKEKGLASWSRRRSEEVEDVRFTARRRFGHSTWLTYSSGMAEKAIKSESTMHQTREIELPSKCRAWTAKGNYICIVVNWTFCFWPQLKMFKYSKGPVRILTLISVSHNPLKGIGAFKGGEELWLSLQLLETLPLLFRIQRKEER